MPFIDTHSHIYGEEFAADLDAVVQRAKNAGAEKLFLPNENAGTLDAVLDVCDKYPGFCFPMIGLHPEEIKENYSGVLDNMERRLQVPNPFIAVGEVGIDYHFQSENKAEQICAFRRQTEWAGKYSLPLMIHSRDSIDDLLAVLEDCGGKGLTGVFHCFSGTEEEARRFLSYPGFVLGIGGIVTFKRSTLAEVLKNSVPVDRILLETDCPYMAPVPMRGKRNESAFVPYIAAKIAETYGLTTEEVYEITCKTAKKIFPKAWQ